MLRWLHNTALEDHRRTEQDLEPALRKLSIKASSRVRDFLLTKICLLKRPKTNVQIVQQSSLLKYKYFMHFLREHSQEVYGEIRAEYMSVMSRILAAHFRMYLVSMEKLQTAVACESDVIGVIHTDSSTVSKISGLFQKATRDTTPERVFELGERVGVLADPDEPAVIPHVAENAGAKLPYEVIFRSVHKLLMDTATSEHFFCVDFFADGPAFKELLVPVVAVVEAALAQAMTATTTNWDMVGCLLMIRVNHSQRGVMSRRRVPCLDDYLDRVQLLLWPRFKVLFDLQLSSLKSASDRHLASDSPDVHIVVRRYAALAASMLFLMAEYDSDDTALFKAQTFYDMMDRLWAAIFDLLLRMSNLFKDRRSGIIFLTVNYAHIVSTLRTADTSASPSLPSGPGSAASAAASSSVPGGRGGIGGGGGAAGKARSGGEAAGAGGGGRGTGIGKTGASAIKECEDQFQTCMGLYVEDQMARRFQFMVDFVKKAEQQQKRGSVPEGQPIPSFGPAQAGPILRDFASRWKGAVEAMHREASTDFARSPCERDVLQASMTALLKYYTRMLELVKHQGPEGAAMARDAVNVPSIMYEIKRISKS
ncbi:hypothetical protein FOA52_000988 [Chlamydomonas sp. UWO 241]|nr:hypothetical protein FOA52_000988 [Chlamydomonas sp. UWO 241]